MKLFFDMNSNVRKALVKCVWLYKLCASTEHISVQNFKTAKNEKNNHYLQNSDYNSLFFPSLLQSTWFILPENRRCAL